MCKGVFVHDTKTYGTTEGRHLNSHRCSDKITALRSLRANSIACSPGIVLVGPAVVCSFDLHSPTSVHDHMHEYTEHIRIHNIDWM